MHEEKEEWNGTWCHNKWSLGKYSLRNHGSTLKEISELLTHVDSDCLLLL
ncbi:hypothetical protein Lalb_Chr09g0324431 [Lupinus albus]|uniref:Uncharacterized protein n=1 Tax=Lupinus albus TaxID=3870 RepID=A0A6A4PZU4_LUPAL|nr:hypothetical protein Lalb_Chr09g0324431 [Lupinus albus]